MTRCLLTLSALVAVWGWGVAPTSAQTTKAAKVTVVQSDQHGAYLANASGRTLYMFTADQQSNGKAKAVSNCYDACAKAWPPLLTGKKPEAGDQIPISLLGIVPRKDGTMQVTYNGWPLYYFSRDTGTGETTGQDVHGFGGAWYLVTPKGTQANAR